MTIEERLEAIKAKIDDMISQGEDMNEALSILGVTINAEE